MVVEKTVGGYVMSRKHGDIKKYVEYINKLHIQDFFRKKQVI